MNIIEQNINKIKKGTYAHAMWRSVANINGVECIKISSGVVRVLSGVLTSKEGVKYTRLFLTHNAKLKTKCAYFLDGLKVSKEEYETLVETPKKELSVCFAKHIEDILVLSNKNI